MSCLEPAPIRRLSASCYTIPTDAPESDGTLDWNSTTLVVVRVVAGNSQGLGFTYADKATAALITDKLAPLLAGHDAWAISSAWWRMVDAVRNLGRPGIASMAISAVDVALWDLKARLLDVPLVRLLGDYRECVDIYGSGGFTSYDVERLQQQLGEWAEQGLFAVKMKVGSDPGADAARVAVARQAIGDVQLFVDANGAYQRKQALEMARCFADCGVTWFEEPVSSDDLQGLRLLRDRGPAGMAISAGEYGYDPGYFRRMLSAGSVDVLQADATRCGGYTGILMVASLCDSFSLPLSTHCAPALHVHVACALHAVCHVEYFHDHVRIESSLFDGAPQPHNGRLQPDRSRAGHGLEFRSSDAMEFAT